MNKNEALAALAAMTAAMKRGDLETAMRLSTDAEKAVAKAAFVVKPGGFTNPKGELVKMIDLSGDGFKPKSLSPNIVRAIVDNVDAVRAALDELK